MKVIDSKIVMGLEAIIWNGKNLEEFHNFVKCSYYFIKDTPMLLTTGGYEEIEIGYYVIKGIDGKFYSCKPEIFDFTYEEVK
jgi:hypothetical protein